MTMNPLAHEERLEKLNFPTLEHKRKTRHDSNIQSDEGYISIGQKRKMRHDSDIQSDEGYISTGQKQSTSIGREKRNGTRKKV